MKQCYRFLILFLISLCIIFVIETYDTDFTFTDPVIIIEDEREKEKVVEEEIFFSEIPLEKSLQEELIKACKEFNVPYVVMLGLIDQETNFHNSIGDNGDSFGYCQIQPQWWSDLMNKIGGKDFMNPTDNFRLGCAIMKYQYEEYGSLRSALSGYNAGGINDSGLFYADSVLSNISYWEKIIGQENSWL